jgi:hypothetical protein
MTKSTPIAHQPRWSDVVRYFFCTYTTYRRLKQLKKWYWQTVYKSAALDRWQRKKHHVIKHYVYENRGTPQQIRTLIDERPDNQPKPCDLFPRTVDFWRPIRDQIDSCGVLGLYQVCRQNSLLPVEPLSKDVVDRIDRLYEDCWNWHVLEGIAVPDKLEYPEETVAREAAIA